MTDKPSNPHDDVFTRWLYTQPRSAHRGANGGTVAVNSAPKDSAALAEHFIDLPLRDLRTGWPACVIDAMASGATLGAMARALTVVARRLYGVSVDPKTGLVIGDLDGPGEAPPPRTRVPPRSNGLRPGRLTNKAVREIREAHAAGERQMDIAARLGISQSAVCRVLSGSRYKGVK